MPSSHKLGGIFGVNSDFFNNLPSLHVLLVTINTYSTSTNTVESMAVSNICMAQHDQRGCAC
jgi:hypothetical protein